MRIPSAGIGKAGGTLAGYAEKLLSKEPVEKRIMQLGRMGRGGGESMGRVEAIARGRRRAAIGGGAIIGANAISRMRSSGISSGANGTSPRSMGGYA